MEEFRASSQKRNWSIDELDRSLKQNEKNLKRILGICDTMTTRDKFEELTRRCHSRPIMDDFEAKVHEEEKRVRANEAIYTKNSIIHLGKKLMDKEDVSMFTREILEKQHQVTNLLLMFKHQYKKLLREAQISELRTKGAVGPIGKLNEKLQNEEQEIEAFEDTWPLVLDRLTGIGYRFQESIQLEDARLVKIDWILKNGRIILKQIPRNYEGPDGYFGVMMKNLECFDGLTFRMISHKNIAVRMSTLQNSMTDYLMSCTRANSTVARAYAELENVLESGKIPSISELIGDDEWFEWDEENQEEYAETLKEISHELRPIKKHFGGIKLDGIARYSLQIRGLNNGLSKEIGILRQKANYDPEIDKLNLLKNNFESSSFADLGSQMTQKRQLAVKVIKAAQKMFPKKGIQAESANAQLQGLLGAMRFANKLKKKTVQTRIRSKTEKSSLEEISRQEELIRLKISVADFGKVARRETVQTENRMLGTLGTEQRSRRESFPKGSERGSLLSAKWGQKTKLETKTSKRS